MIHDIDLLLIRASAEAVSLGDRVSYLLPDADVPLSDEDTGVVDGLGEPELENLGLETTLQEVLNLETENVIELHLALVQDADPDQTPEERVTLEQPLGVLLLEREEDPSGGPDLGQRVLDPPDLPLVPEPVLSDQLQLLVEASLLEWPPGGGVGLRADHRDANHLGKRLGLSCRSESSNISLVVPYR